MKQYKKTILSGILAIEMLAMMLAVPAAAEEPEDIQEPAAAEETADYSEQDPDLESMEMTVSFPGDSKLGRDWAGVLEAVKVENGDSFDVEKNTSIETKSLTNGNSFMEGVINGFTQGDATGDQYVYLVNDLTVAVVTRFHIPDNYDEGQLNESMKMYGLALPVDVAALNPAMVEMVSDQMPIQDGMSSWKKEGFTAVAAANAEARTMSFVVFADLNGAKTDSEVKMQGLTGTETLTPEEKAQVNTYIDFLQSQTVKQVNDFIAFLNSQKQSAAGE